MEEPIEIAPNQLPLFDDVLTTKQEETLKYYKTEATNRMLRNEREVLNKVECLSNAGFTSSHYVYNTERKIINYEANVNRYDEEAKYVEVELDSFSGYCYILYDCYDEKTNKIIKSRASFTLYRDGKIECYALVNSYRRIKPKSLLDKLTEATNKANYEYEYANKVKTNIEYTVNKYKQLYPDAEVTSGKGYRKNKDFDKVTVKFKSGSYVVFEVYGTPNNEYLYEKVDAVTKEMPINELMDYFNKQ